MAVELQSLKSEFEKIQDGSRSRSPAVDLKFVKDAQCQLKLLSSRITVFSKECDEIAAAIDEMLQYSYQYNVKIVGMSMSSERETAKETAANLCLKLFAAMGCRRYQPA